MKSPHKDPSTLNLLTVLAVAVAFGFALRVIQLCDGITHEEPTELPLDAYRHSHHGIASWYRASGMVCACRLYPVGARLLVKHGSQSIVVTVTSRGPALKWFLSGRIIDLSREAFAHLSAPRFGLVDVTIEAAR